MRYRYTYIDMQMCIYIYTYHFLKNKEIFKTFPTDCNICKPKLYIQLSCYKRAIRKLRGQKLTHRVIAVQGVTAFFKCVQISDIVLCLVSCIGDSNIHLPPSLSRVQESNFNAIINREAFNITAGKSHHRSLGSDFHFVLCILHKTEPRGVKDIVTLKSNFNLFTRPSLIKLIK